MDEPTRDALGVRPFNARSLVLSVLLGLPTPRLPASALLRLAAPFGIAPGTMRTALSRMTAAGDLAVTNGDYELRGRLLARKVSQDAGRRAPTWPWDGAWWIVAVTASSRTVSARRDFRARMANARMGELRPDTWLRPANVPGPNVDGDALLVRGPLSGHEASDMVRRLWDLPAIAARCRLLAAEVAAAAGTLERANVLALPDAMLRAAAVVRFLRDEPLLPRALTPADWPVDDLRDRYRDFDRLLGRALRRAVA